MLQAQWKHHEGAVAYFPTASVVSGEIVKLESGMAAVCTVDLDAEDVTNGKSLGVYTEGYFDVAVGTSLTFDQGEDVFWDNANKTAVNVADADISGGDYFLGNAVYAKASGVIIMRVLLNGRNNVNALACFSTSPVLLAFDDAEQYTILTPAQNRNGHILEVFLNEVTIESAGATENQLAFGIYSSDDTLLDTITTDDSTPEPAGYPVFGAKSLWAAAQGEDKLVKIDADLGVYVKVTQPTSGAGAAGAGLVRAKLIPLI